MEAFQPITISNFISAFCAVFAGTVLLLKDQYRVPKRFLGVIIIMAGLFLILTTANNDPNVISSILGGVISILLIGFCLMLLPRFQNLFATTNGFDKGLWQLIMPMNGERTKNRYEIKPHTKNMYLSTISFYMESEKPFLEKGFTLSKLTQRLDLSATYTSRIINEAYGKNFNEFVNTYRIKTACNNLLNEKLKNYTIEGIAKESGFHSRTAFYNAFKKAMNMSPREYISINRKESGVVKISTPRSWKSYEGIGMEPRVALLRSK